VRDTVEITVQDTGPGFPEEFLPHAFEAFSRADQTTDGSGLGLAIVRTISHALGGSARAENANPTGARVTLTLPA
jgi:two-component system, OmpR family, sensor kinase